MARRALTTDNERRDRVAVIGIVVLTTLYLMWEVHIGLVLRKGTPLFGDFGAHLHEPQYLRHHLLPHLRLSGWSQDWFGGYPTGTFYFPLGGLLIAVGSFVLPYTVAFKLVSVLGIITMPAAAYAFGRLNERDRTTSACLAVATLPFLLQGVTLAGGTIGSTVGGEYGYSLALTVSLLVLGFAGAGMRTGRYRVATALLFAATIVLHIIPGVMAAVGIVVLALLQPAWARVRWAAQVLVLGGLLASFWVVPFLLRGQYTTGPEYPKAQPIANYLLLASFAPVVIVGLIGAVIAVSRATRRDTFPAFLGAMAVIFAVVFAVLPTGRVWSARFLPFWLLFVSLLAGFTISEIGPLIDETRVEFAKGRRVETTGRAGLGAAAALLVLSLVLWGTPANRGLSMHRFLNVPLTTSTTFAGYEHLPERSEFQGFIDMVRRVAREDGCGRAHWEWDGDPPHTGLWNDQRWALMTMLPSWTDGCIQATEGLFVQAAATSRYVHLANNHLGATPAEFVGLPKGHLDVRAGVADLRILGARYYIAVSKEAQQQADGESDLRLLASTPERQGHQWKVYEVSDTGPMVEPLASDPVVVEKAKGGSAAWEAVATKWFEHPEDRDVAVTAGGPASWPRQRALDPAALPRHPAGPSATVSAVHVGDDSVSFHVDQTGVPVLVRVSYFPNWRATGAKGPYRATPNWMVVVPTAHDVRLHYAARAGAEWLGLLITLAAIAALVWLARRPPLDMPEPVVVEEKERPAPRRQPPARPKRKPAKRRR